MPKGMEPPARFPISPCEDCERAPAMCLPKAAYVRGAYV